MSRGARPRGLSCAFVAMDAIGLPEGIAQVTNGARRFT